MGQSSEANEDGDRDDDDGFSRVIAGATVDFDEFGQVHKVVLPTDRSRARVTGFTDTPTPDAVFTIVRGLGFSIDVEDIRIQRPVGRETAVLIDKEEPFFAERLSTEVKTRGLALSVVPMQSNPRQSDCRKTFVSWHKATRNVWLNFGDGRKAAKVAQRFNEGRYQCLGQIVRASAPRESRSQAGRARYSRNPNAWTISLNGLPGNATAKDIARAITSPYDSPNHIEMAPSSYQASDAEVSIDVRASLEKYGPLESFSLALRPRGKRSKATAQFQDEADARSACSLNNTRLPILDNVKLTVTLVQSTRIKVSTAIYLALKSKVDEESQTWFRQHVMFRVYPDASQKFTTLKIESEKQEAVAAACRTLDEILAGFVLMHGTSPLWGTRLGLNGPEYLNLKAIEKDLGVVLSRDKSKRQIRFHGPEEKSGQAIERILDILSEQSSSNYQIDLNAGQFSRTIHGGFKNIEHAIGTNVAVFNVVSRKIIINGTRQQYEASLAILDGSQPIENPSTPQSSSAVEKTCPICFCEADNPTQPSCEHSYCLECLESYCKASTTTDKGEFQIKCQGNEGKCSVLFTLRQLIECISSSALECLLKSSFEGYLQRHARDFQYCPTADCGYIYRCGKSSDSRSPIVTCLNCFVPICTSCHARHGDYTCEEYKDIASGGFEALEKLKRELNIKDCPKCKTAMEKTEGCNHMTCGGCKAHICWVCMAVFDTSGPCYEHMTKEHGGIGLGLERFQY